MSEVEGKDRVKVEWVQRFGTEQHNTQIFPGVSKIIISEGTFYLYVRHSGGEKLAFGIPVSRLVKFAALKDSEEKKDEGTGSTEDSPENA